MLRICLLISLTFVSSIGISQSIKNDFEDINAGNYQHAYFSITKKLIKHPDNVSVLFSKALLFVQHDYMNFNLDSAQYYLRLIPDSAFQKMKPHQQKVSAKLGVRPYKIAEFSSKLFQEAFDSSIVKNSIAQWNHYLIVFQNSPLRSEAIKHRNELAWDDAKKNFDYSSFKEFIDHYPDATQIEEAKMLYEELLYKSKTQDSTYQSFQSFMIEYPYSPFYNDAKTNFEKCLYYTLTNKHTIDQYSNFITHYPNSPFIDLASDSLYFLSTKRNSIAEFEDFINHYPNNKNVLDAWKNLYQLSTQVLDNNSLQVFQYKYANQLAGVEIQADMQSLKYVASPFEIDSLFGIKDSSGLVLVKPTYTFIDSFSNGLAVFEKIDSTNNQETFGYINPLGKIIIEPTFTSASKFQNISALVSVSICGEDPCQYYFINRFGKLLNQRSYDDAYDYESGFYMVEFDSLFGYVNDQGIEIIKPGFVDANPFYDSIAQVGNGKNFGFINTKGELIIPFQFKEAHHFSEGLASVSDSSELWGFINTKGEWVIKPKYVNAGYFVNGKAKVFLKPKSDGVLSKEVFIDKTGKIVK